MLNERIPLVPICKVHRRSPITVNNDAMTWEYASIDPFGMWKASDPKRIWIPRDGIYEVQANVLENGSVQTWDPWIGYNTMGGAATSTNCIGYNYNPRSGTSAYNNTHLCALYPMKAGDYVTLSTQRSMGFINATDPAWSSLTYLWCKWIDNL
jgi:hypothetical protein